MSPREQWAEQIVEGSSSRITLSPLGQAGKKSMEQGRGGTSGAGGREWSGKALGEVRFGIWKGGRERLLEARA